MIKIEPHEFAQYKLPKEPETYKPPKITFDKVTKVVRIFSYFASVLGAVYFGGSYLYLIGGDFGWWKTYHVMDALTRNNSAMNC